MTEVLVQFVRARLDEDEQTAHACPGDGEWTAWALEVYGPDLSDEVRTHAARHDPARILREVEAKRLMLDEVLASRHHISSDQYETCPRATKADGLDVRQVADLGCLNDEQRQEFGREPTCWDSCGRDARVRRTLELLAMPYSDHPDHEQALLADQA